MAGRPDMIFHLAAIVSGEAEADFDKGYRINLDGTRFLFDAIRLIGDGYRPRVVFTSSIAVFGAPFPEAIGDEFFLTPLTSYGAQKAIGELLLADYTRRGFFDGIGIRLPTICVQAGQAQQGRLRLLLGHHPRAVERAGGGAARAGGRAPFPCVAPLRRGLPHARGVPRRGQARRPGATSPCRASRSRWRSRSKPCAASPASKVAARIRREPDPTIMRIVEGWPRRFDASRAEGLGFKAEKSFDEIIRIHIEDDLGGRFEA